MLLQDFCNFLVKFARGKLDRLKIGKIAFVDACALEYVLTCFS